MKKLPKIPVLAILWLLLACGCASMRQFQAMSQEERAQYISLADRMTIPQRQEYLARGTSEARIEYLKELDLYDEVVDQMAFRRLEEAKKGDLLKTYANATPEEIQQMLAQYDADTQDRIAHKDLQFGWSDQQVILALGRPEDILEASHDGNTRQLWIYPPSQIATYVYFNNGKLANWAK